MAPAADIPIANFNQNDALTISEVPNAPINKRNKLRNVLERYFLRAIFQNSFTIISLIVSNNRMDVNDNLHARIEFMGLIT